VSISCAGVSVSPGDIVVGDDDGVVVIPLSRAEEVVKKAHQRIKDEEEWVKKIDQGIPFYTIFNLKK